MTDNPYRPPSVSVERAEDPVAIPDKILKRIRNGWLAGVVSTAITVVFTVISMLGSRILDLDAYAFIDVAIMLGLSYGVYRKSRVCALLMFAFFTLNKLIMWTNAGTPTGLPLSLVFFFMFGQGVVGTFQYHRVARAARAELRATSPEPS